ncbi:hypothetical protein WDZ92_15450 [Nostoc sp. NIES-2111]
MDEIAGDADRSIDPLWLSETIGEIYDCALDPGGWQSALKTVCDKLAFASGTLSVTKLSRPGHRFVMNYGLDQEWCDTFDRYAGESLHLWGGPERIMTYALDEPLMTSEITPPEHWPRYAYFREILEPRGMIDGVGVALARDGDILGYLGLSRPASQGPIVPGEIAALRLIAPHLRRAVTIGNLFDMKSIETATFQSTIDAMSCAVVLVDEDLKIVHANPSAQRRLDESDLMRSANGRLAVAGRVAGQALQDAIAIAAGDEAQLSQRGIGIPAIGRSGATGVLHVLPLERRSLRLGLKARAVAAIFALPSAGHAPIDEIATLYGLTPAESRIFAALCRGETLEEAAAVLGIAKSTARTHLLSIFGKTGCSRQAELLLLVSKLSLSV